MQKVIKINMKPISYGGFTGECRFRFLGHVDSAATTPVRERFGSLELPSLDLTLKQLGRLDLKSSS